MRVGHLLTLLAAYPRRAEVRFVTKDPWPTDHGIAGTVSLAEIESFLGWDPGEEPPQPPPDVVFVLETRPLGHGRHSCWVAMEALR